MNPNDFAFLVFGAAGFSGCLIAAIFCGVMAIHENRKPSRYRRQAIRRTRHNRRMRLAY